MEAQLLQGTGSWRDHFPYNRSIAVCQANEYIFCATPYSVFTYNTKDKSIDRISKANYLSDVGITAMEYSPYSNQVIVGYDNGNIDLITPGSGITIPSIRLSSIIGNKAINEIFPYGEKTYLATGFGIVVLDIMKQEIRDTYFIGPNGAAVNVYDIAIDFGRIYAATDHGLYSADINNTFLANFENWTLEADLPTAIPPHQILSVFNSLVLVSDNGNEDVLWRKAMGSDDWQMINFGEGYRIRKVWTDGYWLALAGNLALKVAQGNFNYFNNVAILDNKGISSNACIVDEWGQAWSADEHHGLVVASYFDENSYAFIKPQGPRSADTRKITAYNDNIWIAHGGIYPYWGNLWNNVGVSAFVKEQWKEIVSDTAGHFSNCNNMNSHVSDFMQAAIDPNNNDRIFYGSFEDGLIEINGASLNGKSRSAYNGTSPGPKPRAGNISGMEQWVGVAGVTFDKDGVLWCTNSYTEQSIHALNQSGVFYDFNTKQIIGTENAIGDIIVGRNGYVYAIVVNKGLLVFDSNGTLANTSDDNYRLMTEGEGKGNLPSNSVLCIEEDLDGEIWVGTDQGLAVIYNPESIFSENGYDAEYIYIQQDGNTQKLLATEAINAIEIDGSNRKWIGTRNSGAYLFSGDGLKQIYHFDSRWSALPDNNVYDIAINHSNGEVFFGTEKGIMGYFSTATNFDNEMKEVRVFPNPVRPDYDGNITIDGLAFDTNVKIADIQGNIVYETKSEGGRAIWNGLRFDGERPSTGVYLIYLATKDGKPNEVKKITFIR